MIRLRWKLLADEEIRWNLEKSIKEDVSKLERIVDLQF